jgi:hypothetical protein
VFYLPKIEDNEEINRLKELIIRWGGIMVDHAEAKTY